MVAVIACLRSEGGAGGGEDWIATGLVRATMIGACARLMMLGRVRPTDR
jgi:hypothetical protein